MALGHGAPPCYVDCGYFGARQPRPAEGIPVDSRSELRQFVALGGACTVVEQVRQDRQRQRRVVSVKVLASRHHDATPPDSLGALADLSLARPSPQRGVQGLDHALAFPAPQAPGSQVPTVTTVAAQSLHTPR